MKFKITRSSIRTFSKAESVNQAPSMRKTKNNEVIETTINDLKKDLAAGYSFYGPLHYLKNY